MVWNNQIPARAEGLAERSGAGPELGQGTVLLYIQRMIAECYHEDSNNESIIILHSRDVGARPPRVSRVMAHWREAMSKFS